VRYAFVFVLIACLTGLGTYVGATELRAEAKAPLRYALVANVTPTANQFGADAKIAHPDCVQAKPGRYMCSYAVVRAGRSECHIMQGRWTPDAASTITVTLAGRTQRCASLRDAIRSLR
jgi:hypothetical protein